MSKVSSRKSKSKKQIIYVSEPEKVAYKTGSRFKNDMSSELFRQLIDSIPNPIFFKDEKGYYKDCNVAFEKMLGLKKKDIIGKTVYQVAPSKLAKKYHEMDLRLIRKGGTQIYESKVELKSGKILDVLFNKAVVSDGKSKKTGLVGMVVDISERKEIEKSIEKESYLLNETNRIAKVGGWELDVVTKEVFWTDEVYRIHDISKNKKYNLSNAIKFFDEPDRSVLAKAVEKCMKKGEPYALELRFTSAKGKHLWTKTTGEAVKVNGKVIKLRGTFQDITDRKHTEIKLAESEGRIRSMVENVPCAIYRCKLDKNWTMIFISSEIKNISGYSANDFYQNKVRSYASIIHPDDASMVRNIIMLAVTKRRDYNIEYRIIDSKGNVRWVSERGQAFSDSDGSIKWLDGAILDITDRKIAVNKLEENEQKFRDLVEGLENDYFFYEHDKKGVFSYLSPSVKNVLGYSQKEFGTNYKKYLTDNPINKIAIKLTNLALLGKKQKSYQLETYAKDGSKHVLQVNEEPVFDENHKVISIKGICHDITDEFYAKREIERERSRAENYLNIAGVIIIAVDSNQNVTLINERGAKILGYKRSEIIGKNWFDNFIPEDIRKNLKLEFKSFLDSKTKDNHAFLRGGYLNPLLTKKGSKRLVFWHNSAIRDEFGNKIGILSSGEDITEKQRLEEELFEKNNILQGVLDSIPDIIGIQRPDHSIIMYNKAGYEFLVKTPKEVVGKKCYEIIGRKKPCEPCATHDAIKNKKLGVVERYEDGLGIWLECRSMPVLNSKGEIDIIVEVLRDITARKKSEIEIKKQKDYAETILKLVPSAVFTVDTNKIIQTWNKRAEDITGFTAEEVIGKPCLMFARKPCEDACGLFESNIDKPVKQIICTVETKSGESKKISKNVDYLRDSSGKIIGGIESFEDITEKEIIDEHLREFSRVVEQSPSIIVITDIEGNIQYVNPKFTEITGYAFDEVKGKNPRILKSGDLPHTNYYKNLWNTIKAGNEWKGEFHNKKKNGELYWESASISAMKDGEGNIVRYLAIKEDITDKKMVERELLRLASFPELDPNPTFEVDINGIVTYLNPVTALLFPDVKEKGKQHGILRDFDNIVKKVIENKVNHHVDEILINEKVFERNVSYVVQENVFRFYMNDITERKKIDSLKDEFVSTVSHELRTPLSITKEGISLILDKIAGDLNDKQEKLLITSRDNIDRLARIINDLLDVSKIESGKVVFNMQSFDIAELIDKIETDFSLKLMAKKLEFRKKIQGNAKLIADKDKISQVLINLIDNSIRFTDTGYIEVFVEDVGSKIKCIVSDTGVGISSEAIPFAFDKFKQFGRVDGPGDKGTGLGLPIVKGIIEKHGGKVWMESELGVGTKVGFIIPKRIENDLLKDIKILIVDDETAMVDILSERFGINGFNVITAYDGVEAIEKAEKEKPDVMLVDAMIPKINGFEVCKIIKENPSLKNIKIVMHTVKSSQENIEMGRLAGADDYVVKPLDSNLLVKKIKDLVGKK